MVSIIMPVYNQEKYVKRAIESCLKQTYSNIELVIVNDGSTDNSAEIISKIAAKDDRIKFINRSENKGTSFTRAEGYRNSTGEYIYFLDPDDYLRDNKAIEIMERKLKENDVDIVRCDYMYQKNNDFVVHTSKKFPELLKEETILRKGDERLYDVLFFSYHLVSLCIGLMKRKYGWYLEDVPSSMLYAEDVMVNSLIYANCESVMFIPDKFYVYYENNASITKRKLSLDKLKQKREETIIGFYELVKIAKDFKEEHVEAASERFFKYIVQNLVETLKAMKAQNKVMAEQNFIDACNEFYKDKRYKEVKKYFKNKNYIESNFVLRKATDLLAKGDAKKLYNYINKVYIPLYKLKR